MRHDPRPGMGVDLKKVGPPFRLEGAKPASPALGGTLDLGIVGTLPNGEEVLVGELWAKGLILRTGAPAVSLDVQTLAKEMIAKLNGEEG